MASTPVVAPSRFLDFGRDPLTTARRLLGQRLVRVVDGERLAGVIVEVEAYLGAEDRAAHTFGNRRTERNASMYLAGGHCYVYFIYGLHHCLNIVCGAVDEGVYVWGNVVSARALDGMPEREVFSHLDDWIVPMLQAGATDVRGEVMNVTDCVWEPVGTPQEYLHANLALPALSYFDPEARARANGARIAHDLVLGSGATLGPGARLRRAVVWDGEHVPAGLEARGGVFAGGRFHGCEDLTGDS